MMKIKYIFILVVSIMTINLTAVAESANVIANPNAQKTDAISKKTEEILVQGSIVAIDIKKQQVTIKHKAISELNWPAMTMLFSVSNKITLTDFKVGDHIQFTITKSNTDKNNENIVVTDIKKLTN